MSAPFPTLVAVLTLLAAGTAAQNVITVPGDAQTVQDAVDLAQDGDTILLKGLFPEEVHVDGRSDLTIMGRGKAGLAGGAESGTGLSIHDSTRITVSRLTLEGFQGYGVLVTGSTDVTLHKLRIEKIGEVGILAQQCAGTRVERCRVAFCDEAGIAVSGAPLEGSSDGTALISRCKVSSCDDDGVVIDTSGVTVERTVVTSVESDAFAVLEGGFENTFDRCVARAPDADGFDMEGDDNLVIRSKAFRPGENGIEFDGDGNFAERSSVRLAGENGVEVDGDSNRFTLVAVGRSLDDGFDVNGDQNQFEKSSSGRAGDDGFDVNGDDNFFEKCRAGGSLSLDLNDNQSGTNIYVASRFKTSNIVL